MGSEFWTPINIALFVFGLFGAGTTIGCFIPQGIKTLKTRDTSGLSHWFFIIAITSSAFWLAIGSLTIASGAMDGDLPLGIFGGLPSILTNVVTVFINVMILFIKLKNMRDAKALGISEIQHCANIALAREAAKKEKQA
ncbi:MAG: SemiSWEET family sugar transporter [Mycoplasma sp.]